MKNISYTALHLNEKAQRMLKKITIKILDDLKISYKKSEIDRFSHHMTICLGELDKSPFHRNVKLNQKFNLIIDSYGYNEDLGVLAFKVKTKAPSKSETKHITAYVKTNSKPYLSNKITKWNKIDDFIVSGTVSEFEAGNDNPVGIEKTSLLESILFGQDLSIIEVSLLVLYSNKLKEMICYGYDLMDMLKEAGYIAKNTKIIDIYSLQKNLNRLSLKVYAVDNSFLKQIKNGQFKINKKIVNKVIKNTILMESDFSNYFGNSEEVIEKSMPKRKSILTGDYNVSGRATDKDNFTITKLEEELIRRGVDSKTAIIVAKDMVKNGVKSALRTAFAKGYIPNIYKIETHVDQNTIEGDYYVNNFIFATYLSEF